MASIQKVAKGWRVQISIKGQRDDRTLPNKALALEWAAKRETEMRSISSGAGSKTHTVNDALRRYAKDVSPTKKGARWEILRLDVIGRKEIDGQPFSAIRLADLKPSHIAAWRDLRMREVAGSSVSREMSLLSHVMEIARKEWGWILVDPMKDIRRPADGPPRDRLISQGEIDAICVSLGFQEGLPVVLPSQRVAVAFLFAIETAMRAGEILGLTSLTVDMDTRVAHLPLTKNGSARNVPLSTRAVALLKMLPAVEAGMPLFALKAESRDALFRKGRDRAMVTGLTFHDTRHEAITRLAKKLQILDLARMTGHKNLQELMTYYNATASDIAGRLG